MVANIMQLSSANDKNFIVSSMTFYGVLDEIWDLNFNFKVHFGRQQKWS